MILEELGIEIESSIRIREKYIRRLVHRLDHPDPNPNNQIQDLHELGDLLLLLRSATVSTVELIARWQEHKRHREKPLPYLHEGRNYLQKLAQDTSFLDKSEILREWLGFRLDRNPFVTPLGLDMVQARALNKPLESEKKDLKRQKKKNERKLNRPIPTVAPPRSITLPLVSILPEDDPVDGSRVLTAQEIVLAEEGLFGQWMSPDLIPCALEESLSERPSSPFHSQRSGSRPLTKSNQTRMPQSVYDEYQKSVVELAQAEKKLRGIKSRVVMKKKALNNVTFQMEWIQYSADKDRKNCVLSMRRREYSQQARNQSLAKLDLYRSSLDATYKNDVEAYKAYEAIVVEKKKLHDFLKKQVKEEKMSATQRREKLESLESQQLRALKEQKQQQYEKARKAAKRRADKVLRKKEKEIASKEEERLRIIEIKKLQNEALREPTPDEIRRRKMEKADQIARELEAKREQSLQAKRSRLQLQQEEADQLERQRKEAGLMSREDTLSARLRSFGVFQHKRRQAKQRAQTLKNKPIYQANVTMNQLKYRISIAREAAQGYTLEGLLVHAYEPLSKTVYEYRISDRQYQKLRYGTTPRGYEAWVKWFCIVYNKRKHAFELKWSGPACALPHKINQFNPELCSIFKAGVRLTGETFVLLQCAMRKKRRKLDFVMIQLSGQRQQLEYQLPLEKHLPRILAVYQKMVEVGKTRRRGKSKKEYRWVVEWKHSIPYQQPVNLTKALKQTEHRVFRFGSFGCRISDVFCLVQISVWQFSIYAKGILQFSVYLVKQGLHLQTSISIKEWLKCQTTLVSFIGLNKLLPFPRKQIGLCCDCSAGSAYLESKREHDEEDDKILSGLSGVCVCCHMNYQNRWHSVFDSMVCYSYNWRTMPMEREKYGEGSSSIRTCIDCGEYNIPIVMVFVSSDDSPSFTEELVAYLRHSMEMPTLSLTSLPEISQQLLESLLVIIHLQCDKLNLKEIGSHLMPFVQYEFPVHFVVVPIVKEAFDFNGELQQLLLDCANETLPVDLDSHMDSLIQQIAVCTAQQEFEFEHYLIAEALVIEAVCILLYPALNSHRFPESTISARSWTEACRFLASPEAYAKELYDQIQLRRRDSLTKKLPIHRRDLSMLQAYTQHPEWNSVTEATAPLYLYSKDLIECIISNPGLIEPIISSTNDEDAIVIDPHYEFLNIASFKQLIEE